MQKMITKTNIETLSHIGCSRMLQRAFEIFVRILFLHPNFPAQFKSIASHFALEGHDVRFLCQTHYNRSLKGVQRICLKNELGHDFLLKNTNAENSKTQVLSRQYLKGMETLKKSGWNPDIIISHSGWGCGLYTKLVWQNVLLVCFLEWWFDVYSSMFTYDPNNTYLSTYNHNKEAFYDRNQSIALELTNANLIIAPTEWQKKQLPQLLSANCVVIHDGIDYDSFNKDFNLANQHSNRILITYGTRGMEPIRCFKEFVDEAKRILGKYDTVDIEIAGEDIINYGGAPPNNEESWGEYSKSVLKNFSDNGRVKFLGRLNKNDYIRWLHRSDMHVYLTQPFVASWSLLEAMACRCFIVANSVEPVKEFCNVSNSWLVDSRQSGFLNAPLETLMANPARVDTLRVAAQKTARRYSSDKTNGLWAGVLAAHSSTSIDL